jgi:hypothetical protein
MLSQRYYERNCLLACGTEVQGKPDVSENMVLPNPEFKSKTNHHRQAVMSVILKMETVCSIETQCSPRITQSLDVCGLLKSAVSQFCVPKCRSAVFSERKAFMSRLAGSCVVWNYSQRCSDLFWDYRPAYMN